MDEKQKNTETKAAESNASNSQGNLPSMDCNAFVAPTTSMEQTQSQAADAKKQAEASVSKV